MKIWQVSWSERLFFNPQQPTMIWLVRIINLYRIFSLCTLPASDKLVILKETKQKQKTTTSQIQMQLYSYLEKNHTSGILF